EEWGVERFAGEFRRRAEFELRPPVTLPRPRQLDHIGRFEQGDGREFYGVFVENGRVLDTPQVRYRSAFRTIAQRFAPGIRLTPMQSILFTDLDPAVTDELIAVLREHGVPTV